MVITNDRCIKLAYIFRDQENIWLWCHRELLQVRKLISLSPPPHLSLHSTIIEKQNKRLAFSAWRRLMAADVMLAVQDEEQLQGSVSVTPPTIELCSLKTDAAHLQHSRWVVRKQKTFLDEHPVQKDNWRPMLFKVILLMCPWCTCSYPWVLISVEMQMNSVPLC